jgi:hypothetical protein
VLRRFVDVSTAKVSIGMVRRDDVLGIFGWKIEPRRSHRGIVNVRVPDIEDGAAAIRASAVEGLERSEHVGIDRHVV